MTDGWKPFVVDGELPGARPDDGYDAPGERIEKTTPHFKTAAAFCAEYVPLAYAVDGIVRSGSIYTITARTGAGKTAFLIAVALAISSDRRDFLNIDIEPGRVAYIACENPDDIRMRLMISAFAKNIDLRSIGDQLVVLDARHKPEELLEELRQMAVQDPFRMIVVDTLAAFFDGDDINNAVQGGEFMRRLRPLTRLPGLPSVLIAAHPVKNAAEDNLVPYGSGAILNEVDGNLTLWKEAGTASVTLHWSGKLRGLEFEPRSFRFGFLSCPDVVDVKGRQVQLPLLDPVTAVDIEQRQKVEVDASVALLHAMIDIPNGSQQDWAKAIDRTKSNVNRKLQQLKKEKLVAGPLLGKWSVTDKGRTAISK